jgi:putative membrane protein
MKVPAIFFKTKVESSEITDQPIAKPPKRNLNRIRDHLANERTYLSWMRSAIALMGFGVLIVRLRILRPPLAPQPPGNGWKLGLAFAIVGLLAVLLSTQHYFAVRDDIEEDTYEPPDRWIILSSITILLLGMGVIYYVFSVPLESLDTLILE